jgi:Xaa-Pro dipeptidase
MSLQFDRAEWRRRLEPVLVALAARQLDFLLLFKHESMYWLSCYDPFGYCFFHVWCCKRTAIWPC